MRFRLFAAFALSMVLALSLAAPKAHASVSVKDLTTAAQAQDLQGVTALLLAEGLDQAALDQVTAGEPITLGITDLGNGSMVVTLEDFVGQSLWCFLTVNDRDQAGLVAWEILGDYPTLYQDPVPFEGQGLLVPVKATWVTGSGVYLSGVTWYLLSDSGLNKVLDYPEVGDVTSWGLPFDRSFGFSTLSVGPQGDAFVIATQFDGCWSNALQDDPGYGLNVLCYQALVNYKYDAGAGRFAMDPASSEMTQGQLDALFTDDADGFLANNFERLKALATEADDMTLGWLARFLDACADSPQKAELQSMLE